MCDRGTLINNAKPLLYPVYLVRKQGSGMKGKKHIVMHSYFQMD